MHFVRDIFRNRYIVHQYTYIALYNVHPKCTGSFQITIIDHYLADILAFTTYFGMYIKQMTQSKRRKTFVRIKSLILSPLIFITAAEVYIDHFPQYDPRIDLVDLGVDTYKHSF